MEEKTVCKKCGFAGERKFVPYKIIADIDGESVRFVGQICEKCFEEMFGRPPTEKDFDQPQTTEGKDDESSKV